MIDFSAFADELEKISQNSSGVSSSDRSAFREKYSKTHDLQCSLGKDKKGFFAYTHRSRTESYPSPTSIPIKRVEFVSSTS